MCIRDRPDAHHGHAVELPSPGGGGDDATSGAGAVGVTGRRADPSEPGAMSPAPGKRWTCLLYTSDAADERSSVDLGGRRIIKKQHTHTQQHIDCLPLTAY